MLFLIFEDTVTMLEAPLMVILGWGFQVCYQQCKMLKSFEDEKAVLLTEIPGVRMEGEGVLKAGKGEAIEEGRRKK